MPQVPYSPVQSVAPSGGALPSVGVEASGAAFGTGVADAVGSLGKSLQHAGNEIFGRAVWLQQRANETAANDLYVQADIEAGKLKAQYNSLEGKAAVDALPKYQADLDQLRQNYLSNAPNDEVARNFDKDFKRRLGYMIVDAGGYAAGQNKRYNNSVLNAKQGIAVSDAASNPQDDRRFEQQLEIVRQTSREEAKENFYGPEVADAKEREAVTKVWSSRLTAMAQNDPLRARELLRKNYNSLDGISAVKLNDQINQKIIQVQSRVEADKIVSGGGELGGNYVEEIKKSEGYSPKAKWDYKQMSSGYGTKAQEGDDNLPSEQLRQVHENRFNSEIGRAASVVDSAFPNLPEGTRAALISLTYNTGSSWVGSGLGAKLRAGDVEGAKQSFLEYNKAGGQTNEGLVARRQREAAWFGQGETVDRSIQNEAGFQARLQSAYGKVSGVAEQLFPDDPGNKAAFEDALRSRVTSEFSGMRQAIRLQQQANLSLVTAELVAKDKTITKPEQMSLQAQQAFEQLSPMQQRSVLKQFEANAKADVPYTPERQKLFNEMAGMAKLNPEEFRDVNIMELDLPKGKKDQLFAAQRQNKANEERSTGLMKAMAILRPMLNDAQIIQSGRDDSTAKEKNAQYNSFAGALDEELAELRQRNGGKAPTEKEIRDIGARLLTVTQESSWLNWTDEKRAFQPVPWQGPKDGQNDWYEKLPVGSRYIGPDGKTRIKKAK